MSLNPNIVILAGGVGAERDVSILSGQALSDSLSQSFPTRLIEIHTEGFLPISTLTAMSFFPVIHGEFGEDGELQNLLEEGGFEYTVAMYHQVDYASIKPKLRRRYFRRVKFPQGIDFKDPSSMDAG